MAMAYRYVSPQGYYTNAVDGQGYDVANATLVKPTIVAGFWPRWPLESPNAEEWEQVEDHRKRTLDQGFPEEAVQEATPFWLPGDLWDAPARTMKEIGPLPEGALPQPPEMPLEEAVKAALTKIMSGYAAAFGPVEAMYPAQEREGWSVQLEEARAVLADESADVPTLAAMVKERNNGETVRAFAQIIIANNAAYRAVYASLTGQQQRMYRDVQSMAATNGITAAHVLAYPVAYTLPEGM